MNGARLAYLFGGLLACADVHAATEAPIQLGPFSPGMTLDQARAAAPQLAWDTTKLSPYLRKPIGIAAQRALELGGLEHSIEIEPGYYGDHVMRVEHEAAVPTAAACEALTLPVVAELESKLGPFKGEPKYETSGSYGLPRWETRRLPSGGIVVTPVAGSGSVPTRTALPHDRVKAGKRSVLIFATDAPSSSGDPFERHGYAEHKRDRLTVRVDSKYERNATSSPNCEIGTLVHLRGDPPEFRKVELPREALERTQSIGLKHHSLDNVTLPATDVAIAFDCRFESVDTTEHSCRVSGREPTDHELITAARVRLSRLSIDPSLTDPDDPVPLKTTVTLVLSPSDQRSLAFVASARTPVREIEWADRPMDEDMKTLRYMGEGVVSVACQVQGDGSLICAALDDSNAAIQPDAATPSQKAAVQILRRYVAEPKLRSGAPSAGVVFSLPVDFRSAATR